MGAYVEITLFGKQEQYHPGSGDALGDDGCQSGAPHAHMEPKHENGIQDDVAHGSDQYGEHSGFCISLGIDKRIQSQRQLHENGPQ